MMVTTTIYKYIQSELIKNGKSEMTVPDDSKYFDPPLDFIWFDDDLQFTTKILKYDEDIEEIVNQLFAGLSLKNKEHDHHFKKTFINRFTDRQINRQTIESFQMQLVATFLSYEDYINTIYEDMEKFITQTTTNKQNNNQSTDGQSTSDNRSAFQDLPQSSTNLDLNDTTMDHATDNTISRNKEVNNQVVDVQTTGENKSYNFDELAKVGGVLEKIYNEFDRKCFLQVW